MTRFLIEVPHEPGEESCALAARVFLETGSHFLANADYGCHDDDHRAWMIVELDSKEEARAILPLAYRSQAKIVQLTKFNLKEIDATLQKYHH